MRAREREKRNRESIRDSRDSNKYPKVCKYISRIIAIKPVYWFPEDSAQYIEVEYRQALVNGFVEMKV